MDEQLDLNNGDAMKIRILTVAIFLALVLARGAGAQNLYYLPHVANGNFDTVIFRTTFILVNNSDAGVTATLNLTDDSGSPMTISLGSLGTGSKFSVNLDGGASGFLQTDGLGQGVAGAATVTATATISVSAIFTVYDANGTYMTDAGVGSSKLVTQFVLPVDSTGSFLTGLVLFNPGADASLSMTLINTDGSQAGNTVQPLKSSNHRAVFLAAAGQLFPAISNFRGTLLVQSTSPVAALVLRQYQTSTKLSYTSLPVVPSSSTNLALNLAQVANGSYGSISFATSFLIFNISAAPANISLALTQDNGSPFTVTIPGNGPGTGTNSSFNFTLAAGASIFLKTDGLGAGTSGAAIVTSNVPVGASAVFTVLDAKGQFQTEAGVGDAPALTSMTLPVDITGSFDTGIAFFNPGSTLQKLTFKLLDGNGVIVNTTTSNLAPKNHLATFVDNLFIGMANFRGSLTVTAPFGIAATTLRQYASGTTYTTLPVASGASSGSAQVPPLLTATVTGVDALIGDPAIALSAKLLPGSVISGTVGGAGLGLTVVASSGKSSIFSSQVNPFTGRYLIVVPDGTYNLSATFQPAGAPTSMAVTLTYTDPNPVQVVSRAVRDITLPAATLISVSGTVSGLSVLPAGVSSSITCATNDSKVWGQFALDASGKYQGLLPAGSYVVSIDVSQILFLGYQSEALQLYNIGSLTVTSSSATGNYALPLLAKLSGTVSGANGAPSVSALDTSATPGTSPASSAIASAAGLYQMILAQNRSYSVGATYPVILAGNQIDTIGYPVTSSALVLNADAILDLNIPKVVQRIQISGFVTDSTGIAVPNAVVTASSQTITNAANVGYSASVKAGTNGLYNLLVPAGTNFRLTYLPPAPKT